MQNILNGNWLPISEWHTTGRPWPATENEWRYLLRNRAQNGLDACISRIGRTLLVDEAAFLRWIEAQREAQSDQREGATPVAASVTKAPAKRKAAKRKGVR